MSTVIKDLGAVSAYAYAVEKGYTGTEEEFAELMADYADVGQRAEDAAESALNSKTAAQTAATTATNKASDATTAATTATNKASEAQTSAQTASTKASEASQSASTASQKATEASQSATNAGQSAQTAEQAKTASQTAQGLAESARDSAISAKNDAESARDEAQDIVDGINAEAEQIDNNTAEITELKNDGVVPSAEQLLSKNTTADAVPYHFRQTGGNGADREYLDAVVGGTVGWNQLANVADGKYVSTNAEPTLNTIKLYFRLQNQSTPYIYHETISSAKAVQTIVESTFTGLGEILHNGHRIQQKYAQNMNIVEGYKYLINLNFTSVGINTVGGVVVEDIMCIDLTSALGSAIADYIYQLEQTTAGAGVAFFKALFPNDYYPYNAGGLVSVSGLNEHKMVGFNQWDEEWELGTINNSTGANVNSSYNIRSKGFIPVVPNEQYHVTIPSTGNMTVVYYDANKHAIRSSNIYKIYQGGEFNTLDSTFVRFYMENVYGTTYNHDICINLSDPTRNGEYEPYKAHSYPLDSTVELRGIPKIVDGKVCFDGDVYEYTGKVTRNTILRAYQSGDESLANAITDGTNTVVYSANASTETAEPYQHLQQCDPNGTEEYVSTGIVPVGHNSFYPENLRVKIEQLPWNFANLIAPTEPAFVATRNYTTGALFIVNNVLYKATSNIANGGTITPNTNCTATTLAEIISALA